MREKIITILNEINPELSIFEGESFLDAGMLESMEIMDIVVKIEEEFKIEIIPTDIIADYFVSIDSLIRLVERNK